MANLFENSFGDLCDHKARTYRHRPEPTTRHFDISYLVIAKSAVASCHELMILPSGLFPLFPSLHTTQSLRDAEVYRLSLCKLPIVGVWQQFI